MAETITNIIVENNNDSLLVSAEYEGGFTEEIKKEIMEGVSREFFYYIVLYRVIPRWYDEEKASKTIHYIVKYDILKKQFHVTRSSEHSVVDRVFDTYEDMVHWVSTIDKVNLVSLKTLSSGHTYYVGIKAEIKAGKLPFLLRYLLFFVPYSEFSTGWAYSNQFKLADFK